MKKYLLSFAVLLAATVSFTSCDDDDNDGPDEPQYTNVLNGVYVVNEGSYFNQINGSLDFLAYDDATSSFSMTRNIFDTYNGRSLGGTPNNALIYNDSVLCIAVTDENRIEFVNTQTKKASTPITIQQPRELAWETGSQYLYVSSYTGKVTKIDMATRTIAAESAVIGANLEGISVSGEDLYVCNSWNADGSFNKNVVKLNTNTLVKVTDINVVDNPTKVIAAGTRAFVLSMGNYGDKAATVQLVKGEQVDSISTATMMAYDRVRKLLYMVNAPYGGKIEYKVYNEQTKKTTEFIIQSDIFAPYEIAVDEISGDVYISSMSEDKNYGGASYTTDGKIYRISKEGLQLGSYDCGVCPGTIVCYTSKIIRE